MKKLFLCLGSVLMCVTLAACNKNTDGASVTDTLVSKDEPAASVTNDEPVASTTDEEPVGTDTDEKLEASVPEPEPEPEPIPEDVMLYLDPDWEYADYIAVANDGAMLYHAQENRKNIIVAVDAGHGTTGASGKKLYCHPDKSLKTTGGSTAKGALEANAQGSGMTFNNGYTEREANLKVSLAFMERLLAEGYDVIMLRETDRVELDLLARTLIANHYADCHISIHYDGDGCDYDKGAYYVAVPDGIKEMPPVDGMWEEDDRLGACLIDGLEEAGRVIYPNRFGKIDLIQTSYSTIPSVDLELGNQCSVVDDEAVAQIVDGLIIGVDTFFAIE